MTRRYHIIGDIHGMSGLLDALMRQLAPEPDDTCIFVGDLVDKGPDSAGVVRRVRQMAENADFEVVLVEGNHENLHRRYRRNLTLRPEIAAEQAARNPELATITTALDAADIAFLDSAVPFWRIDEHDVLVVHGGIPGNMEIFPVSLAELDAMTGKQKRSFEKILRTRFVDQASGEFIVLDGEKPGDPFWADIYDGRFGHVLFGHTPFLDGVVHFPYATGIDTGAVYGGPLTGLTISSDGGFSFTRIKG